MPQNNDLRGRIAGQSAMAAVIAAQQPRAPRCSCASIGISPLTAEGRAHYRGAVGELLVGSILDHLGHSWDILHGVPLGDTRSITSRWGGRECSLFLSLIVRVTMSRSTVMSSLSPRR